MSPLDVKRSACVGAGVALGLSGLAGCSGSERQDQWGGPVGVSVGGPGGAAGDDDADRPDDDGHGDGDDAGDASDGDDSKFDVGSDSDLPGGGCNDEAFSYIWIANSGQDTVSKIDTRTGVEEGRYLTGGGSPSRTSVNLRGDVAVSSRNPAGVAKIAARREDCADRDGDGQITTSTGPHDVLPWGDDECVLWFVEIPSSGLYQGPRPTAWEGGAEPDAEDCDADSPRLWVGFEGLSGDGVFWRLDGDDGTLVDSVTVPAWPGAAPIGPVGPYGGAVNAEGDLWVIGINDGPLVHIDADTLAVTSHGNPGLGLYGIGLDAAGNPWVTGYFSQGTAVYDVAAGSFTSIAGVGGKQRGLQIDREGRGWAAGNMPCRLVQYDVATRSVTQAEIELPGCKEPVGVSIDVDGFVWVVDKGADQAYKVDPETYAIEQVVAGLDAPYTYSDMTGAGLNLVVHPPG